VIRNLSNLLLSSILLSACTGTGKQDLPEMSFDGLTLVESRQVATAYINKEVDFGVYRRIKMLEPLVAFRGNWQRDQNRTRTQSQRINDADMERIRQDVGRLFSETFQQVLVAGDGYEIVDESAADVLLLRPAIINLDVTAPDKPTAGRSNTFVGSAGTATLYLELYDSGSGAIIGRVVDRQSSRYGSNSFYWANSVSNSAEAKRIMKRWATLLRGFLDNSYMQHLRPGMAVDVGE
jgi:hypothetical protein